MALFCPVWLHLMAPSAADEVGPALEALCHEHIAVVYAASSPAAAGLADAVAEELAVPVRIDADLDALDVAGFGHGGHPSSHCAEALQSIADLHRGEHVVVVGGVPAPEGAAVLRRLEIGDDGGDLLPETQSD